MRYMSLPRRLYKLGGEWWGGLKNQYLRKSWDVEWAIKYRILQPAPLNHITTNFHHPIALHLPFISTSFSLSFLSRDLLRFLLSVHPLPLDLTLLLLPPLDLWPLSFDPNVPPFTTLWCPALRGRLKVVWAFWPWLFKVADPPWPCDLCPRVWLPVGR